MRTKIRKLRRNIPLNAQDEAAQAVAESILSQAFFPLGNQIALYMAVDGELGTDYLLNALLAAGKSCFLPVLEEATTTLKFRQYLPESSLESNFYGLLEPDAAAAEIDARELSTVFMPLVAFDSNGNRLGMGKGYYDRTFAFLKSDGAGPVLIGLGHECQRVESLQAASWDVPLEGIITDRQIYRVS